MSFKFPTLAEDDSLRQYNRGTDSLFREMDAANEARVRQTQELEDNRAALVPQAFEAYEHGEDRSRKQVAEDQRLEREAAAEGRNVEEYEHKKDHWGAEDEALGMELEAKKRAKGAAKRKQDYDLAPGANGKTHELDMWETGDESAKLGNKKTLADIDRTRAAAERDRFLSKNEGVGKPLDMATIELGPLTYEPDSAEREAKIVAIAHKYKIDPAIASAQVRAGTLKAGQKEDKPPTEQQSKAAKFAGQANRANAIVDQLEADGFDTADSAIRARNTEIPLIGGRPAATPKDDIYRAAQDAFINAVARDESGAAIGKDEKEAYRDKYFPIPGESPEGKDFKAQLRRADADALHASAGPHGDKVGTKTTLTVPNTTPKAPVKEDGTANAATADSMREAFGAQPKTLEQKKARIEELRKRKAARGGQ